MIPVKYECDLNNLTCASARLKFSLTEKLTNGALVTPTPGGLMMHIVFIHYSGVIMGAIAHQINTVMIVYWTVYSGADQRKHQSSASLAFAWKIHRWPLNFPHKGPVTRKCFYLMTPSCSICHIQCQAIVWNSDHTLSKYTFKWRINPTWWRIKWWPVNSPHKDQWRRASMFTLICTWLNVWVNNRGAGDLRRLQAHDDVAVMK